MTRHRLIPLLAATALLCAASAAPAQAGPFAGAIVGAIGLTGTAAAVATAALQLAGSIAFSLLSQALAKKPDSSGLEREFTTNGEDQPQSFIIGRYATSGQFEAPPYTFNLSGDAFSEGRKYLNFVISVSDAPGVTLRRVIVDGDYVPFTGTTHPWLGQGLTIKGKDVGWVRWHDGHQTIADGLMRAAHGTNPDRPWGADMIGTGIAYAVLSFRGNSKVFPDFPDVRFEVDGIPLYDPRADDTVGGDGAQRWGNPATWTQTNNPMVMAYNVARGIMLPDGSVWGGGFTADSLPLGHWIAAMNACDELVEAEDGVFEPRYRAGLEVRVDAEPAEVMTRLAEACSAQYAEFGGRLLVRVGGPGTPVLSITDDDILVTDEQEFAPFPGLADTVNGITATFPDPEAIWEVVEAPPRFRSDLEAVDGGRRLLEELRLPAVPYPLQVQRLQREAIEDHRRFREHTLTLPPDAALLEPLDAIEWTSARNGYDAKVFEVVTVSDRLPTLSQTLLLRERDPADFVWNPGFAEPVTPPVTGGTPPGDEAVEGFAVAPAAVEDAASSDRRPAIRLQWTPVEIGDLDGLRWELRRAGTAEATLRGTTLDTEAGALLIVEGLLPVTDYEVRAQYLGPVAGAWTAWQPVLTPDLRVDTPDIAPGAVSGQRIVTTAGADAQITFTPQEDSELIILGNVSMSNSLREPVIRSYNLWAGDVGDTLIVRHQVFVPESSNSASATLHGAAALKGVPVTFTLRAQNGTRVFLAITELQR